jgi:hypothetical protein
VHVETAPGGGARFVAGFPAADRPTAPSTLRPSPNDPRARVHAS